MTQIRKHILCNAWLVLALLGGITFICACTNRPKTSQRKEAAEADTIAMKYARLLTLVQHPHYTEVLIASPWKQEQLLQKYYLVQRTDSANVNLTHTDGNVIYTPIQRSVVALSSICQLAVWLQAEQQIKGACDCQYINIPTIQQLLSNKDIADCGNSMQPSIESIVNLKADALFISPFEGSDYSRIAQAGVPIIECAEYMEKTALGRAEWIKLYALLFGKEEAGKALFEKAENNYKRIKDEAHKATSRPGVLTEKVTSGTWYCPGGQSTMASMIADANGRYLFADDTHSGSQPLAPETVLSKGQQADVWFFITMGSTPQTKAQLLAEYHGYATIKALNDGNVYQCPNESSPYFDELSFRPDYLLQDLTWMFHPELRKGKTLRYFK